MGYSQHTRVINERLYNFKYMEIETIGDTCIYCGVPANVWDHVPPIVLASNYEGTFILVPACRECNGFLNRLNTMDLEGRRRHIIGRILARRKSVLNTPDWDENELDEIEGWVNEYIKSELKKKKCLMDRMGHMMHNISETFQDYVPEYTLVEKGIVDMVEINERFFFERNSECWILHERLKSGINPKTRIIGEKKRFRKRYYPTLSQLMMAALDISLDTAKTVDELKEKIEKTGKEIIAVAESMGKGRMPQVWVEPVEQEIEDLKKEGSTDTSAWVEPVEGGGE